VEIPADRAEVLSELLFVARNDNDPDHGGALHEQVQRDLRRGLVRFRQSFGAVRSRTGNPPQFAVKRPALSLRGSSKKATSGAAQRPFLNSREKVNG